MKGRVNQYWAQYYFLFSDFSAHKTFLFSTGWSRLILYRSHDGFNKYFIFRIWSNQFAHNVHYQEPETCSHQGSTTFDDESHVWQFFMTNCDSCNLSLQSQISKWPNVTHFDRRRTCITFSTFPYLTLMRDIIPRMKILARRRYGFFFKNCQISHPKCPISQIVSNL